MRNREFELILMGLVGIPKEQWVRDVEKRLGAIFNARTALWVATHCVSAEPANITK